MPWYDAFRRRGVVSSVPPAAAPEPDALTAAAAPPRSPETQFLRNTERWQNEVWAFHDTLGEFNFGIGWQANMLSRVRLRAARLQADQDEPEIVTKGPAADLMMRLSGGVGGQAQLMKRLSVQLALPGEGYLIGETVGKLEQWQVRSVDEVRVQSGVYQVMDENTVTTGQEWRDLAEDHHIVRVWRPHDRYYHLADSPARSAREVMRELELINRKITAEYLSRLASAGVVLFPDEMTFPVREEFADEPNPLMAEWIDIAATAIKNPGTASAVIPIPLTGPADVLDKVKLIDFTLKIDEKTIERRDSAIRRLAMKLDIPSEILLGMGQSNHWSAWAIDEGALKAHIAPLAELICDSLTRGYLQPRLEASGEDPSEWVVWYDMSELALKPDRSDNATLAYDRQELSGAAYRRELGFDEDDAPEQGDMEEIGLKLLLRTVPNAAPAALDKLVGHKVLEADTGAPATSGTSGAPPVTGPPATGEQAGPPKTQDQTPPTEKAPPGRTAAEARTQRLVQQARTQHMLKVTASDRWELFHPPLCGDHEYSCPFTHAVSTAAPSARPGSSGTYLCHLDAFGRLVIDGRSPYADTGGMIATRLRPRAVNGHATAGV